MPKNKYTVGDLVELKSGGPIMTVQSEHRNSRDREQLSYYCQWFAGKKLELGKFPEDSLQTPKKNQNNEC